MVERPKPIIRPAMQTDVPAIRSIVNAAYSIYLPHMEKPPGPMLDDYAARVAAGEVYVLFSQDRVGGILVLIDQEDHLLLDNVAVAPSDQGKGFGGALIAFAEAEARRRGYHEIRLYTHVAMADNVPYYEALGWRETHRARQAGYDRIFMCKRV